MSKPSVRWCSRDEDVFEELTSNEQGGDLHEAPQTLGALTEF